MLKKKKEIDVENLNSVIVLSKKILKVLFVAIILISVLLAIVLCSRLHVGRTITSILRVAAPLFIGFVIAWLLNPVIKRMCKHGFNRVSATIVVYVLLLAFLSLLIAFMVPNLKSQLNEFINLIFCLITRGSLRDKCFKICICSFNVSVSCNTIL